MTLNLGSRWLALPFLLLIVALALTSMARKSATLDEPAHLEFGRAVLLDPYLKTDMQRMPITALNAVPVLLLEHLAPEASDRARLFAARSVTVLLSCVLAWLVFLWSRELWGWQAGLFSLALYSVSPNLLAHARWVTNDLALSLFLFMSVRSFLRYLKQPTTRNLLVSALITGCAQFTKHSALLLLPILGLLLAAHLRFRCAPEAPWRFVRGHLGLGIRRAAAFGLIVMLVINAGYLFKGSFTPVGELITSFQAANPQLRANPTLETLVSLAAPVAPIPLPLPAVYVESFMLGVYYNATGKGHGPNYLLGETDTHGWWYYFLVALAFKLPLGLCLLLALSMGDAARRLREGALEEFAFLLVPVALIVFMSTSSSQLGVRYVLPILPLLFVSLGRLVLDLPRRSSVYKGAVGVAVAWMAISSLSFYPHYLSYFNEFVGSRLRMYKILADSNVDWGQNAYYLDDYLRENTGLDVHVNPREPSTGRVVVTVNELVGILVDREQYAWLRASGEPVGHIAYSWLIYQIDDR